MNSVPWGKKKNRVRKVRNAGRELVCPGWAVFTKGAATELECDQALLGRQRTLTLDKAYS